MSRERWLPDDATMEKVIRYEAHLNKQLYQAIHELEAMRARREGEQVLLARLEINGRDEDAIIDAEAVRHIEERSNAYKE